MPLEGERGNRAFEKLMKKKSIELLFLSIPIILTFFLISFVWAGFWSEAEFIPASENNYCSKQNNYCEYPQRSFPTDIRAIVIHTGEGSFQSIISWFQNPKSRVSAHYVVSREGKITAMVNEEDVAWQAGNWEFNTRSIGIEHEAYSGEKGSFTEEMYQASARLVRALIAKWKIPPIHPEGGVLEPKGIIGHNQVLNPKKDFCQNCDFGGCSCHFDPGPHFDWNYYLDLITGGGKPDLFIENFNIEPAIFSPGQEIKISFSVKNQGKGDTIGSFFVEIFFDDSLIFEKEIGPLNSKQGQDISFSFTWPKTSTEHTLKAQIKDPFDYILEEDLSNNQVSRKLQPGLNHPPKIKNLSPLKQEENEVTFKAEVEDPDGDEIKYILLSSKEGVLEETDFASEYQKEFKKTLLPGKHRLYLQVADKREGVLEPQIIQDVVIPNGSEWQEIEIEEEVQLSEKEIAQEFLQEKTYHFPLKVIFKLKTPEENAEIRYCLKENCLPLVFKEQKISSPFFLEFLESQDIILRYQALNPQTGGVSIIKEQKIRLRLSDIDKNGKVDLPDLSIMMAGWDKPNSFDEKSFQSDLDADGIVNLPDLSILMACWGK